MRPFYTIKQYYNNSSIRKKLFLILLLISIIPMVVIQMINYMFSTNILRTHVDNMSDASLKQSHSEIELGLKTYYNLISSISNDESVSENLSRINVWDSQYQLSQRDLREEIKQAVFTQNGVLGIAIVAANGEYTYYDTVTLSVVDSYCFSLQGFREQQIVEQAQENPEEIYMEARHVSMEGYEDKNLLYLSKSLSDYRNLKTTPIGTVVLCVDEDTFSSAYQQPKQGELDLTFVVNQEGSVVSSSNEAVFGGNIYEKTGGTFEECVRQYIGQTELAAGKALAIKSYTAPDSNYTMVNVQWQNYLLNQIYYRGSWIILIALLSLLVTVLIIDYTANNIDRAVHRIVGSMHMANKGDLDVRIDNDGKDEFAQISQNFNEMIAEMKKLIRNEKQALDRKRKAEIKALEAQINPHFLYNTLDSINWIAIKNKQFEVSKMLKYLAIILRYSIADSNAVTEVKRELEYLRKYIYVQQNRFQYSFLCLIDAPDEVLNFPIHKLLMQPLIENSMEHAFPGKTGQDRIEISLRLLEEENKLRIVVSDNGVGMSDALIEELNNFDCEAESIKSNIGIRNVITRIRIYYGEAGGFSICENPDCGVRIELTIPYEGGRMKEKEEETQ